MGQVLVDLGAPFLPAPLVDLERRPRGVGVDVDERFPVGDGTVPKDLLHVHFEQEWEVYVRDFPVLIGRAYVVCPIAEVRRELAENLYEEETGGLSAGKPHPELFLRYPRGLGFDLSRFDRVELLPGARAFRSFLDEATLRGGWAIGAAVTTLFLEGTK